MFPKDKCDKYTAYSSETGVTKTNQSTLDQEEECIEIKSIPDLSIAIRNFALDRNWSKFHTPRNITLAMMGEVGELAELFQWNGDIVGRKFMKEEGEELQELLQNDIQIYGLKIDGWDDEKIDKVQQEIADVAIYCLRLADVVGVENVGDSIE